MLRFVAGVCSALLLVAAGFFLWRGQAEQEKLVPPAPQPRLLASPLRQAPPEAPATADKSREEKRFGRYDKDENGLITRAEMMDSRRAAWTKLDTNGNGSLSFEEWAVATADKFAKADADHNGSLTAAEFATTAPKRSPKPKCTC